MGGGTARDGTASPRLPHRPARRAQDQPAPAELHDVLAEDLTGAPVADIAVEGRAAVGGLEPAIAAPHASPTKPRSQIGVSRSRSAPYLANSPTVVPKLPPRAPMPSPRTKIRGFTLISWSSASSVAATYEISRPGSAP